MKKYLFFFFNVAPFCLSLSGCSSDNDVGGADAEAEKVTFYADYATDGDTLTSTRTVLDATGNQFWSLTDVINVNGQTSTKTALPGGTTYAAFTVTLPAAAPYYAFYPGNATNLAYNSSTHVFTYDFPATQAYNESAGYSFSDGVNPMVAYKSLQYLTFYNVCGILKAEIQADVSGVRKIRFLSADKAVAGTATVNPAAKTLTVSGSTMSMDVTFSSDRAITTASPLSLCWVLPVGTYGTGWQIQLLDADGDIIMKKIFTNTLTINRSGKTNAGTLVWDSPTSTTPYVDDGTDTSLENYI